MKEKYIIAKSIYKDYIILLEKKDKIVSLSSETIILKYFDALDNINTLTITKDNKIENAKDYKENNKYYNYLIKAKLIDILLILKEKISHEE